MLFRKTKVYGTVTQILSHSQSEEEYEELSVEQRALDKAYSFFGEEPVTDFPDELFREARYDHSKQRIYEAYECELGRISWNTKYVGDVLHAYNTGSFHTYEMEISYLFSGTTHTINARYHGFAPVEINQPMRIKIHKNVPEHVITLSFLDNFQRNGSVEVI